jgi:hypothetical protein
MSARSALERHARSIDLPSTTLEVDDGLVGAGFLLAGLVA